MNKKLIIYLVICLFALAQLAAVAFPQTQTEIIIEETTTPSCTSYSGDMGEAYFEGGQLHHTTSAALQLPYKEHAFTDMRFEAEITYSAGNSTEVSYGLNFGNVNQNDETFQNYELVVKDGWASIVFSVWPSGDTILVHDWIEILDYNADLANHFKVLVIGDSMEAYVNETQMGPVQIPYPASGHVRFSTWNFGDVLQEQHIIFDNVKVTGTSVPVDSLAANFVGPGLPSGDQLFYTDLNDTQDWIIVPLNEAQMGYVTETRPQGLFVVIPKAYDGMFFYHKRFPCLSNARMEAEVELVGGANYTLISLLCRSSE